MTVKTRCLTIGLSPAIQRTTTLSRRGEENVIRAGGKCLDVCRALVREEMDTVCLTVAGRENWETFRRLSLRENLPLEVVPIKGKMPMFTTTVDGESGKLTEVTSEASQEITPDEEAYFIDVFGEIMMEEFCGMIITGNRLPGFSEGVIPHMVRAGKEKGLILFADYAGEDLRNSLISVHLRPDYVKISKEEFLMTFGTRRPIRRTARRLSRQYGNCFIITEEDGGTLIADQGRIPRQSDNLSSGFLPYGWGDTLTAGLAQGILEGRTPKESVELGFDHISRYGRIERSA
jgi:fructose-1-phosphate kinase PfkB-like protein